MQCWFFVQLPASNVLHLSTPQLRAPQDASKPAPIELKFSLEVQQALQQHKPVVALESTIISHGAWQQQRWHALLQLGSSAHRMLAACTASFAIR
jgi:pseudouridine-5'-phosphate glycosidase